MCCTENEGVDRKMIGFDAKSDGLQALLTMVAEIAEVATALHADVAGEQ